ncbi:hypothetical protein C0W66_19860 [Photobacterium kishitanii]|nr:hypothetical protein C0W66_19860 [Photobacterium kishitanii]
MVVGRQAPELPSAVGAHVSPSAQFFITTQPLSQNLSVVVTLLDAQTLNRSPSTLKSISV